MLQHRQLQRPWASCSGRSPCRSSVRQRRTPKAASTAEALALEPSPAQKQGHVLLYYRTNWREAFLHGSVQGQAWQDYPMHQVTSAPGKWLGAAIPLSDSAHTPIVEFVVNNKKGAWDKPPAGGNYVIREPGNYTLRGGRLTAVQGTAVMIVSDLDGTMVGDDEATAAFKSWWEDTGVVRGGMLVYNTGRSLDSFIRLQQEKAHCLAHPDVLISAVGTKIYTYAADGGWQEDGGWVGLLDKGWDVTAARDAAYTALAKVGKDSMHFRPPEEQNNHKVTCGVAAATLQAVLDHIQQRLDAAGVHANIIVSGKGDWRFMDIVPIKAGKLEALEYVRSSCSFPLETTVACGDSGNDILMLSGKNPAVVVGNAQPDLVQWVVQRWGEEGSAGKERLLLADAPEALGILQGLQKLGLK